MKNDATWSATVQDGILTRAAGTHTIKNQKGTLTYLVK
jgi:hypothetical protein